MPWLPTDNLHVHLQALYEYFSDAIVVADSDWNIVGVNPVFTAIFGYDKGDVIGRSMKLLYANEDNFAKTLQLHHEKDSNPCSEWHETLFQKKDGSVFWTESRGVVLHDANRRPNGYLGVHRDITERKRAEAERTRLLNIINDATDLISTSDMAGNIRFINAAGLRMVGLPEDIDFASLKIEDFHPPWATRRVMDEAIPAVLDHDSWQGECALLHRDGHEIPTSQLVLIHRDESGQPQYLSTIIRDNSEQKGFEAELIHSKNRYQGILQNMIDSYWRIDISNGRIIEANSALCKLHGYSIDEILQMSVSDFQVIESLEDTLDHLEAIRRAGHDHFESEHRCRDGRIIELEISANLSADDPRYVDAFHRDITERKHFIEKLIKRERQLRESQEVARLGSWDLDLVTPQLEWSEETYKLFDTSSETFTPSFDEFARLVHPDDRETMQSRFGEAVASDAHPYHVTVRVINDSGRRWIMEALGAVKRDAEGRALSIHGTAQDITDRKRLEQDNERERSRLQTILRMASDGIHILDEDGMLVEANDAFLNLLGYDRSAVGRLHVDDWDVRSSARDLQDRKNLILKLGQYVFETCHRRRDGSEIDVEVSASSLILDGKVYVYAATRDITERKIAARAAEQYRTAVQASIDGFWVANGAGQVVEANESVCRMHGYSREELLKLHISDLDADESTADTAARIRHISEVGRVLFEARHRHKDGSIFDVEVSIVHVPKLGELFFSFIRDITERKRSEARLQLAASVFTHAREGITITDINGTILDVNDTFCRITGYTRDEAIGRNPRILKSDTQPQEFYEGMWRSLKEKGYWTGEIWNRRKDGEVYAEILTISAIRDAAGNTQSYVGLFTDITALKEQQKQLEHIAHYDVLTNLPNRVLLADRLQQAMAQSRRHSKSLAVVYLDLDGFKQVNDQFGHSAGDELLISIARRMKAALRDGDTLSRFGGDEFVAVLVDLDRAEDCEPVLVRLLQAAASATVAGGATFQGSASIGVTVYPADDADAEQLIRHADQAMYQAKQAGKNQYHLFDVEQDTAVKTHRESLARIRHALEQHEFVLYYQPKVNMKTGEVIGAEALIRWQHPERGVLGPAAFLPLIENDTLATEVGTWVIDTALAQIANWQRHGLELPVSVNVSAQQLQHSNFVADLSDLLARYPEVKPAQLELEILETSALEDIGKVSTIMETCLDLGVGFALDDFGTGYSSLTYLKHLPAKWLKIDQAFVREMPNDTDDLAIVEAVIGLGTAFRRKVIAEGVETVAHGELLLPLGCECGQGYCIARPMPAAELPEWMKSWRPDPAWVAWRERSPGSDDLAIVFAEVEHRHWMSSIEIFLTENQAELPPMDPHDCRFGQWLDGAGQSRFGQRSAFMELVSLHERVHALARVLVDLHVQGRRSDVLGRLKELNVLRGELIAKLRDLLGRSAEPAVPKRSNGQNGDEAQD